jgi:hypothetical protein
MSEACSTHGAMRDAQICRVMVGKPEGKNRLEDLGEDF